MLWVNDAADTAASSLSWVRFRRHAGYSMRGRILGPSRFFRGRYRDVERHEYWELRHVHRSGSGAAYRTADALVRGWIVLREVPSQYWSGAMPQSSPLDCKIQSHVPTGRMGGTGTMTSAEYSAYQKRYYEANREKIRARQNELRKSDPTYKARARKYTADWRVKIAPSLPRVVRRQGSAAPFRSRYGIYGMTERSYPPSQWGGILEALMLAG